MCEYFLWIRFGLCGILFKKSIRRGNEIFCILVEVWELICLYIMRYDVIGILLYIIVDYRCKMRIV